MTLGPMAVTYRGKALACLSMLELQDAERDMDAILTSTRLFGRKHALALTESEALGLLGAIRGMRLDRMAGVRA